MCERKDGESLAVYFFRQLAEKPTTVLAFIGLIAAAVLYSDMRQLMKDQTTAFLEAAKAIQALTLRVENLEKAVNK